MSTIAYRDGIMAADTGAWFDSACHNWARKLARCETGPDRGTLFGVTGSAAAASAFLDWVDRGCPEGAMPMPRRVDGNRNSFVALIARPDGNVVILSSDGSDPCERPAYFAMGAGQEAAWGAMYAGASAEAAIRAAIAHTTGARGSVATIER